jgi:hypothetical protein
MAGAAFVLLDGRSRIRFIISIIINIIIIITTIPSGQSPRH